MKDPTGYPTLVVMLIIVAIALGVGKIFGYLETLYLGAPQ